MYCVFKYNIEYKMMHITYIVNKCLSLIFYQILINLLVRPIGILLKYINIKPCIPLNTNMVRMDNILIQFFYCSIIIIILIY